MHKKHLFPKKITLPQKNDLWGTSDPPPFKLVVIRTLDSSRRDVPVYVVFLQGALAVPVGCLAK